MIPTRALIHSLALAFKTAVFAKLTAPGWAIVLSKSPFTPGPGLVAGDFVADPDWGGFPVALGNTGWQVATDPRDSSYVVAFEINAGVQAQLSTAATGRTDYGWVVGELPGFTPVASELLPAPIAIARIDDQIWNPEMCFRFPIGMWL